MTIERATEVFLLPRETGFIVYAPLAGRAVHANGECAAQLKRYLETGDPGMVSPQIVEQLGGLNWLHSRSAPIPLPVDRHYHPTAVTLFLTNSCNLRCEYCYAQAGELHPQEMSPEVYRAAVDLVTRNARRAGAPVSVAFHGGGEPTLAWETLQGVLDYARHQYREKHQGKTQFALATNGVMPAAHREVVASQFNHVTLSLDGPPDIQDAQRPTPTGAGSFDQVMAFIAVLREHRTPFGLRATITRRNVNRMAEMVDFFIDRTDCRHLHFEPFYPFGRGEQVPEQVPDATMFATEFVQAMDRARERDAVLRYSAARLPGPHLAFCACANDAFNVTPDGCVTACFEVCHHSDPLWKKYCFGLFDQERARFAMDWERLEDLRRLTVDRQPRCENCFAKWNCSGDCPAKNDRALNSAEANPMRCQITQEILLAMLERTVNHASTRRMP